MAKQKKIRNRNPKAVATPPRQVPLEQRTSEELALMLNQQYNQLMAAQSNINAINAILSKRGEKPPEKGKTE